MRTVLAVVCAVFQHLSQPSFQATNEMKITFISNEVLIVRYFKMNEYNYILCDRCTHFMNGVWRSVVHITLGMYATLASDDLTLLHAHANQIRAIVNLSTHKHAI